MSQKKVLKTKWELSRFCSDVARPTKTFVKNPVEPSNLTLTVNPPVLQGSSLEQFVKSVVIPKSNTNANKVLFFIILILLLSKLIFLRLIKIIGIMWVNLFIS
jgi:hypothetical protein